MLLATLGVAGLVAATAVLVARAGGGHGPLVTHGPGGDRASPSRYMSARPSR